MTLLIAGIGLFVYMTFAFCLALYQRDNGVADIAYGCGFILLAWVSWTGGMHSLAGALLSIFVTVWGLRLAVRIYAKNWNKPEDFRYKAMRDRWGKNVVVRSFFTIFMLQGALIFIIALPVMLTNVYATAPGLSLLSWLGSIIWAKGFLFETVGDYQLDMFRKNPLNKGHIMNTGLWYFTRHPNYFGESLMWWGIALVAYSQLTLVWGYALALVVVISPITITYLLLKVSGIPLLEAHFSGEEWEGYKKRTNSFIPWFPKKLDNR